MSELENQKITHRYLNVRNRLQKWRWLCEVVLFNLVSRLIVVARISLSEKVERRLAICEALATSSVSFAPSQSSSSLLELVCWILEKGFFKLGCVSIEVCSLGWMMVGLSRALSSFDSPSFYLDSSLEQARLSVAVRVVQNT